MTQKDHELIAGILRQHAAMSNRGRLAARFCEHLAQDNPRFNPVIFLMAACGLDDRMATRFATTHGLNLTGEQLAQAARYQRRGDPVGDTRR